MKLKLIIAAIILSCFLLESCAVKKGTWNYSNPCYGKGKRDKFKGMPHGK